MGKGGNLKTEDGEERKINILWGLNRI